MIRCIDIARRSFRVGLLAPLMLAACVDSSSGREVGEDPSLERPSVSSRRLTTRGDALIDALGREVLLRGVNIGNRSKMPPFLPFEVQAQAEVPAKAEALMQSVRALGANAVRLTLSWEALEPEAGSFDAAYLEQYEALLDAADAAELHVIVDFHQDVFQAAFCGDGFPEWALGDIPHGPPHYDCGFPGWSLPYFDPQSEVSQAFDRFWGNEDGLMDAFDVMWRHVARELGDHPAVAAFEVINEPGYGSYGYETVTADLLPSLYERIATRIESETGPIAVLGGDPVAPLTGAMAHLRRPDLPRFVYAPHYYDPSTVLGATSIDAHRIRGDVAELLTRADGWDAPVVLGEFGAPNSVAAKEAYLVTILDELDAQRASGLMWDASVSDVLWNGEDFSVFYPDGSERPWAAALDRPFPRALDGRIEHLRWDGQRFELTVSGATGLVSEVYLPVRHLGADPQLDIEGARWRWLPEDGILLLVGEDEDWSLTAQPESPR